MYMSFVKRLTDIMHLHVHVYLMFMYRLTFIKRVYVRDVCEYI